jgi:hypothetical protein
LVKVMVILSHSSKQFVYNLPLTKKLKNKYFLFLNSR